ncbi:MAG TPA: hypothetical protein VG318_02345 [Actinomycetota bacterium]|nr:hypothetical protein [Actinomycetota bacterium]
MGGSRRIDWLDDLGAAFEAAEQRDEEAAAADLAFSLRQDVDVQSAVRGQGWALLVAGGLAAVVDEVGADYVVAGADVVPASRAVLRSADVPAPRHSERSFAEWLSAASRRGASVEVRAGGRGVRGQLVTVGRDHLEVRAGTARTIVGLSAVDAVGLSEGYSASRGLSG